MRIAEGARSTMSNSLTEDYLRWLEPQIRDKHGNPEKNYWDLLKLMFETEFVPLVPYDENREADGRELRAEFCHQRDLPLDALDELDSASFLEVLIGLSRRMSFAAGGHPRGWAWQFLVNLELHRMADPLSRRKIKQAEDILDVCINRTYGPDGVGGFFPLAWPDQDQRKVELWYQMAAYIDELHPETP